MSNRREARMAVVIEHLRITCLPHFTTATLAEGTLVPILPQWRLMTPSRHDLGAISPQSPVAAQHAGIYRFSVDVLDR
ncbi:hypothetical protein [Sodalis sp.]|uniref:hypothetical protein n=1 Tax=Sodalis sp. (in: enterobacteria) TaxID=1898979 RepID=UPI00387302BA